MKKLYLIILSLLLLTACGKTTSSDVAISPTPTIVPTRVPTVLPMQSNDPAPAMDVPSPPPSVLLLPDNLPTMTLDVELFYAERWMRVDETVEITNTSPDNWDEVVFNVPINALGDAFYLDSVAATVGEESSDFIPAFLAGENILKVTLPRSAAPDETVIIEIGFRVVIPPVASTAWPPIGTTGWTASLIQAGEWYPSLTPYIDGEGWMEWRYHPVGDPTVYPMINARLNITTEEGIIIASGGEPQQDGNTWHFSVDGARGIAFIASDQYQVSEIDYEGITLRSYYLSDHETAGVAALQIMRDSIALFTDLYGPYPYESLTTGENGFFGGMEYSAFISITDYAYYTYQGRSDSVLHALIAHETAHQWWYGSVGNDQANEAWLDEAIAFYSEKLYYEYYYPGFVDWWWQARVYQFDRYGPVDATIYSYMDNQEFILSMYGQAAVFMEDLRGQVGDDDFFAFLQDYYVTYYGKIVSGEDFFNTLRKHTSIDLDPILQAYFANTDL